MSRSDTGTTRRTLRQALTIARRDFTATVFTPIFLIFLFAPVLMGTFGGLVGGMGAAGAMGGDERTRIVAIVPDALARPIAAADARLRTLYRSPDDAPPPLRTLRPAGDPLAQARAAFATNDYDATAVLFGPLTRPHILYGPSGPRTADYLATLAGATLAAERLGAPAAAVRIPLATPRPSRGSHHASAFVATFGIFFLTLFLSGQVVGSMAEERANKVIEVLAAAVPLEAVFFGKLVGMFGVALVFVTFWGTTLATVGSLLPPAFAQGLAELRPAVGPAFPLLFFAYFTMAYMLLGAVFLGVGAQATSARELQLLSLPITILQIGMFGLSTAAVSHPGSTVALAAELFPLSSPYAMAGRAAGQPGLWPHVAALGWQALWVAIFIAIGARAFRRGVLQSGSAAPRWRRRASAADNRG
ncbi:MAG: ABC transporter permease [Janthinobacterium lividum]